jgi:short-subunit dehydrogenase
MSSRIALITGASSGIGEATAKRYAASGAQVALIARNAERLEAVAAAIKRDGGSATPFIADLADATAVAEVSARIARDLGTPDILINNAGAGRWLPLIETSAAEAYAMIAVPYLAAFNLARAFLPEMLRRRSGAIAFVTSPASFLAWPNASGYIAARRAVAGLADALRAEVKGRGLTVTLIVLGTVDSPYWEHNPGSREHLPASTPAILPTLTTQEAAEAIFAGVESGARMVVKPSIFRALFVLNAIAPRLFARQLRRAARKGRERPSC